MELQFGAMAYQSASLPVNAQQCINMYVETSPPDSKSKVPVFGCPGLRTFATLDTGPSRGSWTVNGVAYFVGGDVFYSVDANGNVTNLSGPGASAANAVAFVSAAGGVTSHNYVPGDTIALAGGTFSAAAVLTVATTQVSGATIAAAGSGGTNGTQTVIGTTGAGTLFHASVTVSGGAVTAILAITVPGSYTTNPTTLATEPVTGAGLSGAQLAITMGVGSATVTTPGLYTAVPNNPVAQGSSSGAGTGATFEMTWVGGSVDIEGTGNVSMADNGVQVCIVNGSEGYIWNIPGTAARYPGVFMRITDPNFFPAKTVTFFDGYFVFDRNGTDEYFLSNLYDGTSYNALLFATASAEASLIQTTVMSHEQLFIMTTDVIEIWYDAGTLTFPFQRYPGALIQRGCIAPLSVVKEDNTVFWLADDGVFYRMEGWAPKRLSTHAIENAWRSYSTIADAVGFSYTFNGHKFVTLNFPTAMATWVYDISSGLWHQRLSWDGNDTSLGRWRGSTAIMIYEQILVGDAFSGAIGAVDPDTYTEYGNTILGLVTTPPIHADRKRVFIPKFELDIEAGVGLTSGQGSDPQLMLDWSRDGGRTWSLLQLWRSMGMIGEYAKRLRWFKLGQAYQWVFRLQWTDPVKRVLISAHINEHVGL